MEVLQRKLSFGSSGAAGSLWGRRMHKRSQTAPIPQAPPPPEPQHGMNDDQIVPPPADILPSAMSVSYDIWETVPLPAPRLFYPLHNPVGPRFYRNIHLIPPSQIRPGARPPSVFSPSFPPISTQTQTSSIDHGEPGPSSSASSTAPTPSSSQTRVGDGGKPRSRKTSQSTPDNVDLMDVTDPWGTNWHHTSPYDIGLPAASGSSPVDPNDVRRPRRASMTAAQNGYKSTFKSPLSQSTSAVHELPPIQMPRKLSKRQKPTANGKDKESESPPPEHVPAIHTVDQHASLPKRMSVAPPLGLDGSSLATRPSLNKKEKRDSVFGRLARKLSDMRRSFDGYGRSQRSEDDWHHISPADTRSAQNIHDQYQERSSVKRVPPPTMDNLNPHHHIRQSSEPPPHEGDSSSSISVEAPFSMGKLTIANPDIPPTSRSPTPSDPITPLPPEPSPPPIPAKDDEPGAQSPTAESPHHSAPASTNSDHQTTPRPLERALQPDNSAPPVPSPPISPVSTTSSVPVPSNLMPTSPVTTTTKRVSTRYSTAPSQPQSPPTRVWSTSTIESVGDRSSMYTVATATSSVPFPSTTASTTTNLPPPSETYAGGGSRPSSYLSYADSPLSGISVLANPPTPYTDGGAMQMMPETPEPSPHIPIPISHATKPPIGKSPLASSPPINASNSSTRPTSASTSRSTPPPPPVPQKERVVPPPQQISPVSSSQSTTHSRRATVTSSSSNTLRDSPSIRQSTSGTANTGGAGSRQTETFKLVRSESGHGHVYVSGEQWEVVEEREREKERDRVKRESRRDKEKEKDHRRESSSKQAYPSEDEQQRTHRRRSHRTNTTTNNNTSPVNVKSSSNPLHGREPSSPSREREEHLRREREREEQVKREEREREAQIRRERERDERMRREREREREKEREREREREREKEREKEREEQIRREKEEQIRREREEQIRREKEEQRRREREREREREKERERKERERDERERKEREREEREKEKERERKDREREERKVREREERREKERDRDRDNDRKERRDHRSRGEHRSSEDKDRRRSKDEQHSKSSSRDKDDKEREKSSRRRDKGRSTRGPRPDLNKPTPPPPPQVTSSDSSSSADAPPAPPPTTNSNHLTRQPSTSARPTSELPSAADLNALRAKEAWEMERLWRARSMYGTEANGVVSSTAGGASVQINGSSSTIGIVNGGIDTHTRAQVAMSMGSMNLGPSTINGLHGSSHTAFVVQNSLAAQHYPSHIPPHLQQSLRSPHSGGGGGIYAMYPPPVAAGMVSFGNGSGYCPSPPTIPSLHESITSYEIPNPSSLGGSLMMNGIGPYRYGAYHGPYGGSSPGLLGPTSTSIAAAVGASGGAPGLGKERFDKDLPPLANPLPEPPRESAYEPKFDSELWTKYSGLTSSAI